MNRANRQSKTNKYAVRLKREVEYVCDLQIEARSVEEAEGVALATADNTDNESSPGFWAQSRVLHQSAKARVLRK